ncbi:MAG: hypothetical protein Q7J34_03225 [Bacteroidales bacterium]|nr:hypothetical protein [Bacteroidales bacterium]
MDWSNSAKHLIWVLVILACYDAVAQRETDNWLFGNYAGINFASGTSVSLAGSAMNSPEGCTAISNSSGVLLFYSDGMTVWNRNHSVMLNGTGLLGNSSSTQSSIIIPKPGSDHLYFLFTIPSGN